MNCEHQNFFAQVDVSRVVMENGLRFQADLKVTCEDCSKRMIFIGLPTGLDLSGASTSINGVEARLTIVPEGEELTPLNSGETSGFTVKRTHGPSDNQTEGQTNIN